MHIVLLTELYPPSLGGQELFFAGLGKVLRERGHQVDVFCIGHAAGLAPEETIEGIRIRRHPVAPRYTKPRYAWMRRDWPAMLRYALWTRRQLQATEPDLIVLNQWPLLHAAMLPRALRGRAVLHWCEVRTDPFHRAIQRLLPRATAHNAGVSDAVAAAIGQASGRPCFLLPSGLDLASYEARPETERSGILSLGRIAAHKNLPLLVSAYEQLRGRGYAGRLVIAGDGPAMDVLRQRVDASPVRDAIDLPGSVPETEKRHLLATHALMLVTSRREGFPRVVAEAMASGLPVVTTDDPGNGTRDIVRAAGCGVVAPADPVALASAAEVVLAAPETHAANGLRYAKGLDWAAIAATLEQRFGGQPP
jgi:glycosyltransferase involved in cell wall biosynthesis